MQTLREASVLPIKYTQFFTSTGGNTWSFTNFASLRNVVWFGGWLIKMSRQFSLFAYLDLLIGTCMNLATFSWISVGYEITFMCFWYETMHRRIGRIHGQRQQDERELGLAGLSMPARQINAKCSPSQLSAEPNRSMPVMVRSLRECLAMSLPDLSHHGNQVCFSCIAITLIGKRCLILCYQVKWDFRMLPLQSRLSWVELCQGPVFEWFTAI
jgi:hypothetical protein